MKETRFGAAVANLLSVSARGLGYFLWYLLRLIYRGEPKLIAAFAGVGVAIAALVWAISR
jgi:hypothetical protein